MPHININETIKKILLENNISDDDINNIITSDDCNIDEYNIHNSWKKLFEDNGLELMKIMKTIDFERQHKTIYPPKQLVFKAFEKNINDITIVLLGQDPYINVNQAMGLSFSVPKVTQIPPSLVNIFKEIKTEFPDRNYNFTHGDLSKWSDDGIFLLNSALTVRSGKSNSHQELWSWFTDKVINYIDENRENVVFLLLGNNAKSKQKYIDITKNHIITGVHPSPMSASNGFFNSGIFQKIEEKLNKHLDWSN